MLDFIKKLFVDKNTAIISSVQFGKSTDNQISDLLKKATSYKKTDIEQAISLIRQALTIDPDYPCYDKLKNYLIIANRIDEAQELILNLIEESKDNKNLFNFSNRVGNYESYSGILFKKGLYKEYIFYYSLSKYNALVANALNEQKESINAQLTFLRNKEEFIDKKTNKAFQEIGAFSNQDLFIKTLYDILKGFDFISLYKQVYYLNNKQADKEALEIEASKNGIVDWKLWVNKQFQETISRYDEKYFMEKYEDKLEPLLKQRLN
jgi:hypothetical protein